MLRLQAEPEAVAIHAATLSRDRAVEEVPRIELHTRLVRRDVERTARARLDDAHHMAHARPVEDPIVVIPARDLQLLVRLGDPRPDRRWRPEIEGCAGDGRQLARRNQRRVYGRVAARRDLQHVAEYVALRAGEIE